jgi:tetratricopeptide (TPR) repeat protein
VSMEWIDRGVEYLDRGDIKKAFECFDKAILEEPNNANAWYQLGIVQRKSGDYEESLYSLDKSVELDQSMPMLGGIGE